VEITVVWQFVRGLHVWQWYSDILFAC